MLDQGRPTPEPGRTGICGCWSRPPWRRRSSGAYDWSRRQREARERREGSRPWRAGAVVAGLGADAEKDEVADGGVVVGVGGGGKAGAAAGRGDAGSAGVDAEVGAVVGAVGAVGAGVVGDAVVVAVAVAMASAGEEDAEEGGVNRA